MRCAKCSRTLDESVHFCPFCGKATEPAYKKEDLARIARSANGFSFGAFGFSSLYFAGFGVWGAFVLYLIVGILLSCWQFYILSKNNAAIYSVAIAAILLCFYFGVIGRSTIIGKRKYESYREYRKPQLILDIVGFVCLVAIIVGLVYLASLGEKGAL